MIDWLRKMFGGSGRRERPHERPQEYLRRNPPAKIPPIREEQAPSSASGLRAVPGALVAEDRSGQIIYNMLTPHMQQFMGRCVSAIKRAGMPAKGTGQFSVLVGEQRIELRLDQFYQPSDDPALIDQVVAEARKTSNRA